MYVYGCRKNTLYCAVFWRQRSAAFVLSCANRYTSQLHCVQKTCDYSFYNNFNNKCPITIIFGIDTSKSMRHRKMVAFPTSPI